jgi:type III restriction enzyme
MRNYEVETPIVNSPFEEPSRFWYLREDEPPELREGRRPPIVYPPSEQREAWDLSEGTLRPSADFPGGYELTLVRLIRERLAVWREQGYPGATRTTLDLLRYWRRSDRDPRHRLFFAQLEAVEAAIFLQEARQDLRQGIRVPTDEPSEERRAEGYSGFRRLACKLATGGGKTTVMAMVAAWSILNKVADRQNRDYSDAVLVVCPNLTIRSRLQEIDPRLGEASLYRTRDLVPPHLMPQLVQGKVLITNWHVFERKSMQDARVMRSGVRETRRETIHIGKENTTLRGKRYLTEETLRRQATLGLIRILDELRGAGGNLTAAVVEADLYLESDTALVNRVLGRDLGKKENLLVFCDEAHHAYRIRPEAGGEEGELFDEEQEEEFFKEATVWVDGLDRIHKLRRVNFCLDLSATPYFLGRVGQDTNKPFPWVVSDFGLVEAIESGLTKIPQLAARDPSGEEVPYYFNIWEWILSQKLTPAEKGGAKRDPKPEAVLKWAVHPIELLAGHWQATFDEWKAEGQDPRPPVFIIVCKNTKIARVVYEWIAEGKEPKGISPFRGNALRNRDGQINTIRVDTKVVSETDSGAAKDDETRWMRLTLDTVGKQDWPRDGQGRALYPEGFEELAAKLGRPTHPPGRDVRCIVSVGMLTEGWDCRTVTHIIGLRPFMSQLLCEQVVGRGLRRASYEVGPDGLFAEEVSKVLGVPFEVIPYKASGAPPQPPVRRHHVYAIPQRGEEFEIRFPRVEGYTQAIRGRITVDWDSVATLDIDPTRIPSEVQVKALSMTNQGRPTLLGPGKLENVQLDREKLRLQEIAFDLARDLTKLYVQQRPSEALPHVLFPQLLAIVRQYFETKLRAHPPSDVRDVGFSPYFGYVAEHLVQAIHPDPAAGESREIPIYEATRGPGSTAEVGFWTSKPVREVLKCHLNAMVADTARWEESAAYFLDTHDAVRAFVKNDHLGFAIPYLHDDEVHEYVPDFIVRLAVDGDHFLILEVKGFDPLKELKAQAAQRWVAAVNADGRYGRWQYAVATSPTATAQLVAGAASRAARSVPGQ